MLVAASILSADFLNLERDIRAVEQAGCDYLHIDIMDGRFVSNVTWGASIVSAIRKITHMPLDVHLMVHRPERVLGEYVKAGADILTIHPESTYFSRKCLWFLKDAGVKVGMAVKLETPIEMLAHCFDLVDQVLILTCDEGFGGQTFQNLALQKIRQVHKFKNDNGFNFMIQVDGGINAETAQMCKDAGAHIAVAGTYIFKNSMSTAIQTLKAL